MNTEEPMYEWNTVPWKQVERKVFKLQKRIYRASLRGDVKTVHRLQRLLTKSWSGKVLAVRRVTQDNQGRKTAGIDGVKSLTPKQRLNLVQELSFKNKAKPTRRVWIPKPGTEEKRPLGIPTINDRALQALVKLALEPEWEARFEPNTYGFRPGRSCHDAVEAIFAAINKSAKYILDADISKCFDKIDHKALLDKLNTTKEIRNAIKGWLEAGVVDNGELYPTKEGTPQGGIISPLLANIALHGLEKVVWDMYPTNPRKQPRLIRYADDFIVIHNDLDTILEAKERIQQWLKGMGLELKPSKTRITHTLEPIEGEVGFDFLGFHFRHYKMTGKHSATHMGRKLGFKTIVEPSPKAVKEHISKTREVIRAHKGASQLALISHLNPIILGWVNYFQRCSCAETFNKLHAVIYQQLLAWAKHRHPHESIGRILNKYWGVNSGWRFSTKDGKTLFRHSDFPKLIVGKINRNASPYDGDWVYWSQRMGKHPDVSQRVAYLLKEQKGQCSSCRNYFSSEDLMEIHHKDGNHKNNRRDNTEILHRHCHDKIHARSVSDNHQTAEEPYAGKLALTVLKPSHKGDLLA